MSTQEVTQRLTPTKETLSRLFAFSGNQCAFPDCHNRIFDEDLELIGQVCHIEAAMPEGERFNKDSNNEERRKFENLIALCYEHHVKTNNVFKYRTEDLQEMKRIHEAQFLDKDRQYQTARVALDNAYEEEKKKTALILQTVISTENKVDELLAVTEKINTFLTTNLPIQADSPFKSEIDTITGLRNTNSQVAYDLLIGFREKNWDKLNAHEKFRVLANLGISLLESGKELDAADLFLEALQHEPELLKAISLASLGYTIKGDHANSRILIEKALKLDSTNGDAYQAFVHTLAAEGNALGDIIKQIPEGMRSNPEVAYSIGFIARQNGQFEEAVNWLQIARDNTEGSKAGITGNLGGVILDTIDTQSFVLNGTVDQASKTKINLAIEYLDQAIKEGGDVVPASIRSQWYSNRGVAKKFIGDRQGALEDMVASNTIFDDFSTSQHLAITAFESDDRDRMRQMMEKMKLQATTDEEKHLKDLFIADIDVEEGRWEQGIASLEKLLSNSLNEKENDYIHTKIVRTYLRNGEVQKASDHIDKLIMEKPRSVKTLLIQAQFNLAIENMEVALDSLEKAYVLINERSSPEDIQELADLFYYFKDFKKVAKLLEMIGDLNVYSTLTKKMLTAFYDAGENGKLIEGCQTLLKNFGPTAMVTELLAWAYENIDDLGAAIEVMQAYLAQNPDDHLIKSRLAFVFHRQMDKESLKELLQTIDHIDSTLPLNLQYKLARMFHYVGDDANFRRLAYEIRRNSYEIAEAHDNYLSLSVNSGQKYLEELFDEVTDNCAVLVDINNTMVTYVIESESPVFASHNEISPDSKLGKALIGKKVGDSITLDGDFSQVLTIRHIFDKFNHAASESMTLLTTKFLGDAKSKKITASYKDDGTLDIDAMLSPVRRRNEDDLLIEERYRTQNVPIGVVARYMGISPIRVWANFMSKPALGVKTSGPFQEINIAEDNILAGKPLIMDILAITTLSSLQAFDYLILLPNERIVTQSTLEELYDLIQEQEISAESGTFTVGMVDGQYVKQVLSPETIQGQIKQLNDLADWIKTNCTIVTSAAALSMNAIDKAELDSKVGKSFMDTMLTAQERDGVFYAEEMPLRMLAYQEYKVTGCATFIIYRILKDRKLISVEAYQEKILHLMAMNYRSIPVDAGILYLAAVKSKFTTDFPFYGALSNLTAPLMAAGLEVLEAVKFFYKLYAENLTVILSADNTDHVTTLVHATLQQLNTRYTARQLEGSLIRVIDRIFQYMPIKQEQLKLIIKAYLAGR